jgi:hypothetical protein
MTTNQLQFIRRVLYRLKRRYGATADYYRISANTVDESTGLSTQTRTKYTIKRVIRLPVRLIRDNEYQTSFLTANRNFIYGATYDKDIQVFVIDAKDITITPSHDDYIIVGDSRFNVKEVEKLDYNLGYTVIAEAIEGDNLDRIFEEAITQTLGLQGNFDLGQVLGKSISHTVALESEVAYEHTQ